jgi:hypothetical protein
VVIALAGLAAAAALPAANAGREAAPPSPYRTRALGYDLSYPNCVRSRPAAKAFAVVGVNGGKAFTYNRCLRREDGWYRNADVRAFYVNTGYEPRFRSLIVGSCRGTAPTRRGSLAEAYAIGCSEAVTSVQRVSELGLAAPPLWWLDVEPANAWSASPAVNTAVLRGIIDFLGRLTPAPMIGIYSRPRWWREITAGWATTIPEWVPSPAATCPAPFSTGPVWLHQTAYRSIDVDAAC